MLDQQKQIDELQELLALNLQVNTTVLHALSKFKEFGLPKRTIVDLLQKVKDKLEDISGKAKNTR